MSTSPTAAVINLAEHRTQAHTERKKNGHRKGDHGNRASTAMRCAAVQQLAEARATLDDGEDLSIAIKERIADAAGVNIRTLNRWWAAHLKTEVDTHKPEQPMPGYLYRFANPGQVQLEPAEVAFFAQHSRTIDAINKVLEDPENRLSHYGVSTLYRAYANVSEPVRVGARNGAEAARNCEATYPTTGRDKVNETWSIDEYDLKLRAQWNNIVVEPKVLIVRDRAAGLPLSYIVVPVAATGIDTGRVLAGAALGYTVTDPDNPDHHVHVGGVARLLVSDQGGAFIGADGVTAARRLGIGINSMPSHQPQANGDHEQMHQSLKAHFVDGPGSRRGWTDRAGKPLDHGDVPYDWVLEQVEEWFRSAIVAEYTTGPHKGQSRLDVYRNLQDAGETYIGHNLTEEDYAALAVVVAERAYDNTRGLHYNNQYWLSPELGTAGRAGDRITLKQLVDPNVLYAFDKYDRYIGVVTPRNDQDLDDVHAQYANRAARERFVKDKVAKPKARAAAADAAAVWDETGAALADAADQPDNTPDDLEAPAVAQVPARSQARHKPGRTAPAPASRTDVDQDAEAERIADLLRTARTQDADQQPHNQNTPTTDEGAPDAE